MLPDALYILLICIITRRAGIASVFCGRGKGRGKEKLRHPLDTGVLGGRGWMSRAAQNKEPGSRLPAAASCLGRHAHPAGRSPNSSSLFLPLAAVVAVAVRIHPCVPFARQIKTETPVPGSDTGVLGGRGWIRTTEAESSRFTVCPHWPLGNTPIFICCASVRRTTCLF